MVDPYSIYHDGNFYRIYEHLVELRGVEDSVFQIGVEDVMTGEIQVIDVTPEWQPETALQKAVVDSFTRILYEKAKANLLRR